MEPRKKKIPQGEEGMGSLESKRAFASRRVGLVEELLQL